MDGSLAVILEAPGRIAVRRIPVPRVPGPAVRVEMGACGICGSDVRYYLGENPWALHTLGRHLPSPPNLVLGHEVAGMIPAAPGSPARRVAVLAYRSCGTCTYCRSGRENLCEHMEHFGHSAGWGTMPYYPGGMSERFDIWEGFARDIPGSISFEEATFLDGLAVAVHAVDRTGLVEGGRLGVIGLGPIGLLAAQAAAARGACRVVGCDTAALPVELAAAAGLEGMIRGGSEALLGHLGGGGKLDAVVDTVGSAASIRDGLSMLEKSGALVLLAVHPEPVPLAPVAFSGERRILSSANNLYRDFPRAIELLGSGRVRVSSLVTHRFPLSEAGDAFRVMLHKDSERAYKVILHP